MHNSSKKQQGTAKNDNCLSADTSTDELINAFSEKFQKIQSRCIINTFIRMQNFSPPNNSINQYLQKQWNTLIRNTEMRTSILRFLAGHSTKLENIVRATVHRSLLCKKSEQIRELYDSDHGGHLFYDFGIRGFFAELLIPIVITMLEGEFLYKKLVFMSDLIDKGYELKSHTTLGKYTSNKKISYLSRISYQKLAFISNSAKKEDKLNSHSAVSKYASNKNTINLLKFTQFFAENYDLRVYTLELLKKQIDLDYEEYRRILNIILKIAKDIFPLFDNTQGLHDPIARTAGLFFQHRSLTTLPHCLTKSEITKLDPHFVLHLIEKLINGAVDALEFLSSDVELYYHDRCAIYPSVKRFYKEITTNCIKGLDQENFFYNWCFDENGKAISETLRHLYHQAYLPCNPKSLVKCNEEFLKMFQEKMKISRIDSIRST